MESPSYIKECYNHCQAILQKLYEQRAIGLFCDIAVVVEGKTFHAHKNILSACSSYFYTTLSKNNQECTLVLDTVTLEGFSHLLEYFYTSEVPGCHMSDFLSAAQSLNVCVPAKLHTEKSGINGNGQILDKEICKLRNVLVRNQEVGLDLEDLELLKRMKEDNFVQVVSPPCKTEMNNESVVKKKVHRPCLAKIKTRLQTARLARTIASNRKSRCPKTGLIHVNGRKENQDIIAKSENCRVSCQWTKVRLSGSQKKAVPEILNIAVEERNSKSDVHGSVKNSTSVLPSLNVKSSLVTHCGRPKRSKEKPQKDSVLITKDLSEDGDDILERKRLRCEGCKKLLPYTRYLSHQVSAGGELFSCDMCEKLFSYSCQLSQHQKTHHSKKLYQCDQCGKQLKSMEKLRDHVAYHGDARPHQCSLCDKAYKVKNDLTQHIRVKHMEASKGKPPLVQLCEFCGQAVKHYKSHKIFCSGIKKFQCKFCLQAFYRLSELKRHTWTHTGELPYQCRICGKRCRHPSNLKKHIRTVHKEEIRVQIDKEHASPKLLKDFLPREMESDCTVMESGNFVEMTDVRFSGSTDSTIPCFANAVTISDAVSSMPHVLCTAPDDGNAIIPPTYTTVSTALERHQNKMISPLPSFKSLLTSPHVDMFQNSFHQATTLDQKL
ncbi:myoneurin-like [Stegostoma tigrinum]|uniref:myoneurin-like n=1 Tax=Stegostoma tigrinum TaxID=3053191 RepID=UPI00202ADA0B|nr:myoneurin-like [Stegostoma tigrinum]XP_048384225.1 myoneurin-like [Stegostoma tigrinum]